MWHWRTISINNTSSVLLRWKQLWACPSCGSSLYSTGYSLSFYDRITIWIPYHITAKKSIWIYIYTVIYWNPVWDLGLQNSIIKKNSGHIFSSEKTKVNTYLMKWICPCSTIFNKWQMKHNINTLPGFCQCENKIFSDPKSIISHLYSNDQDFYHWILLRIVQTNYSSIIGKIRMKCSRKVKKLKLSQTYIRVKLYYRKKQNRHWIIKHLN